MDDKLDSILAALGSVQRSQTDLYHEVGHLRGEMDHLRGDVGHLRGEMDHLRGDAGHLRGEMDHLRGEMDHLRGEMGHLRGHVSVEIDKVRTDLRADIITTRTQIMERLDRQQAKLDSVLNDVALNWHSSERVERKVEADREEIRSLAKMVSELTRMMRALENRLSIVEEKP